MTAVINVTLDDPGLLKGLKDIDIVLDGNVVRTTDFGRVESIPCDPGEHRVQVVLRALATRKSKEVMLTLVDDAVAELTVSYSKLWGSISLKA